MTRRYHVLRNGIYHYRRRIPVDVQAHVRGRKWWKQSLKTSNERQADERARALAATHDRLIAQLRGLPAPEQLVSLANAIEAAEDDLQAPLNSLQARGAGQRRTQALQAEGKLRRAMVAAAEQRLDTLPASERKAIADMGGLDTFFERVTKELDATGIDDIRLSLRRGAGKLSEREAEGLDAALQTRKRYAVQDQQTLVKLGLSAEGHEFSDPKLPRIKMAMEAWFAARKQGPSSLKRHRVAVRRFVELHGNAPVRDITKPMLKDYMKAVENLPDHRKLPLHQRGGLANPDADMPRIAAPTVERHLVSIKALLNYCLEEEWVTQNVATGLRAPKDTRPKASKRRSFTRAERNQLVARAIEEHGEHGDMTWFIKLVIYTGCRLQELAQIARSNVRDIDGVWIVEIDDLDGRHVKTGTKQLPLHPAIRDDFLAWVHSATTPHVFASFKVGKLGYVNRLSGEFGRLMDRAGLTDPRLVFHSLRHTLKREMANARIDPDVRRTILGHAPRDAHDQYDGHSLEAIEAEFARMPALLD